MSAIVPVEPQSFGEALRVGEVLAESGLFSDTPSAAKAVVKMLAGRELGFGPIQSMTGVDIIKGQVTVKPKLLASAIARHPDYSYEVHEGHPTDQECSIDFYERGSLVGTSTFTIADATRAGLAGKDTWKQYPRNMLWARAMSNGANWYCAGIFGGPVYTPEEMGAEVNANGEIVSEAGPPAATPPADVPPDVPPEVVSAAPAKSSTLDDAIARGEVEGLSPVVTASDLEVEGAVAQAPPEPPAPTDAPSAGEPRTPAELARSYGIADATQRFILITVAGVEDAHDLDKAYAGLDQVAREKVIAELTKRAAS